MCAPAEIIHASCAHLTVKWRTWQNEDGTTSGQWVCRDCSTQFYPRPMVITEEADLRKSLSLADLENHRLQRQFEKETLVTDRLYTALREIRAAWGSSWDCSRDPGHAAMAAVLQKHEALLNSGTSEGT